MSKRVGMRVGLVALIVLGIGVLATFDASAAPAPKWPAKSGDLCFLVDADGEWSWMRLGIEKMRGTHYQLHGWAQQWEGFPDSPIQPLNGSAEVYRGDVAAMITKVEWRGDAFETFNGMMIMGSDLSDPGAVGTVTSCDLATPSSCESHFFEVPLYHDADCDPTNDTHPGFPPVP